MASTMPAGVSAPAAIETVLAPGNAVPPMVSVIAAPPLMAVLDAAKPVAPVLLCAISTDSDMALPLLMAVVDEAKPTVPVLRCAEARLLTMTEWLPVSAPEVGVAVKALVLELVALILLKSLLSLRSSNAVFRLLSANLTAENPETRDSFLVMFLLIAVSRGAFSAATRLLASDLVSMPEPAPMALTILAAAVEEVALVVVVMGVARSTSWVSAARGET